MRKLDYLCVLLSTVLVFGSITMVVGQETETEMIVPMGIIELGPPDTVEPVKTPVEFPHSKHFASVDCRTCHHKWKGTEIITGCMATGCHDVTVSPTKSAKNTPSPEAMIKYYKAAYHQNCIGCHKEIKAQNKQLEDSFKELKEKLPPTGPTGCIECHPKE